MKNKTTEELQEEVVYWNQRAYEAHRAYVSAGEAHNTASDNMLQAWRELKERGISFAIPVISQ